MGKTRKKANKGRVIAFIGIVVLLLAALAIGLDFVLHYIPAGAEYGLEYTLKQCLLVFSDSVSKTLFVLAGIVVVDGVCFLITAIFALIRRKFGSIVPDLFAFLAVALMCFDALLAYHLLSQHAIDRISTIVVYGSAGASFIAWLLLLASMSSLLGEFLPPVDMLNTPKGRKRSKKGFVLTLFGLLLIAIAALLIYLGGPLNYIPEGEGYGLIVATDRFITVFTDTGSRVLGVIAIILTVDALAFILTFIYSCVRKKPWYFFPDLFACVAIACVAFIALLTHGLVSHNALDIVSRSVILVCVALLLVGWFLMICAMRPLISGFLPPVEDDEEEAVVEEEPIAVEGEAAPEETPEEEKEEEPAPEEEEKEEEPAAEEEPAPVEENKEEEPAPEEEAPKEEEAPAEEEAAPVKEEPSPEEEVAVAEEEEVDEEVEVEGAAAAGGIGDINRKSFAEKLDLADDDLRSKYEELKAKAASYGLKGRVSRSGDTYHLGRKKYLKIMIVGKTLRTYYALDPKDYADSPIPVENVGEKKAFADMPSMLRVKSGLSLRRAQSLIDDMMKADGIEASKEAAPIAEEEAVQETKVLGKYEVFPEEDEYKYRLKANNGEILIVSNGYKSRAGAKAGIETLKKNVEGGVIRIVTDKNGYSQFRIFNSNEARLIVSGEFYKTKDRAESASNSVKRFYATDKIVDLDEIPNDERREWIYEAAKEEDKENGKLELYKDETDKWLARLIASNGEVLFITANNYASKSGLLEAIENIKGAIGEKDAFRILKDKQDRYQFVVESGNGSILVLGETYASADSAKNAAVSVLSFMDKAEVVDVTAAE